MNILIKVISSIFYYFFPSLRQQSNPMIERGVLSCVFRTPFLEFFVTGEMCVCKCALHLPSLESVLDAGRFPIQVVKAFASRFSHDAQQALSCNKMTLHRLLDTNDLFCINSSFNRHNCCW